ncbi:MAG: FKBP-type peptidyl-prolyl cis-trans isomerase [Acidobacteria bacterium]|nr:FKBP-type peptidyl-prolyl cis-trans isomerase [Acidobacteriota bacterium]
MKKFRQLAIVVSLIALLAGCAASDPKLAAFDGITPACEKYVGGAEIDQVKVDDQKGKVPTVDFVTSDPEKNIESNLAKITKTQTKVIREGSGPLFTGDQMVTAEYAVFSSTTGELLGNSQFNGTDPATELFDHVNSPVYCNAMSGIREGSLFAFATPAREEDPEGRLLVLEFTKVYLPHANGSIQAPTSGLPQVVRVPKTGRPGLVAPAFDKPTEFKRGIVIEGKGETVKVGDSVTVHYSGWMWQDKLGGTFESSWDSQPATFTLLKGQLISGFVKALDGVKVGSQVIAVMPPEDAYGESGNGRIPPNTTLLFVIDVLGVNK